MSTLQQELTRFDEAVYGIIDASRQEPPLVSEFKVRDIVGKLVQDILGKERSRSQASEEKSLRDRQAHEQQFLELLSCEASQKARTLEATKEALRLAESRIASEEQQAATAIKSSEEHCASDVKEAETTISKLQEALRSAEDRLATEEQQARSASVKLQEADVKVSEIRVELESKHTEKAMHHDEMCAAQRALQHAKEELTNKEMQWKRRSAELEAQLYEKSKRNKVLEKQMEQAERKDAEAIAVQQALEQRIKQLEHSLNASQAETATNAVTPSVVDNNMSRLVEAPSVAPVIMQISDGSGGIPYSVDSVNGSRNAATTGSNSAPARATFPTLHEPTEDLVALVQGGTQDQPPLQNVPPFETYPTERSFECDSPMSSGLANKGKRPFSPEAPVETTTDLAALLCKAARISAPVQHAGGADARSPLLPFPGSTAEATCDRGRSCHRDGSATSAVPDAQQHCGNGLTSKTVRSRSGSGPPIRNRNAAFTQNGPSMSSVLCTPVHFATSAAGSQFLQTPLQDSSVMVEGIPKGTRQPKAVGKEEPGMLVFMTHAVPLDKEKHFCLITDTQWQDKEQRPYDPPISEATDLLTESARKLRCHKISAIWSSPFRACLQTAAAIARDLRIDHLRVHNGLGDGLREISRSFKRYRVEPHPFSYVSISEARQLIGDGIKFTWDPEANVPAEPDQMQDRIADVVSTILRTQSPKENVLIITHGSVFNAYMPGLFDDISILKPSPASFVALRGPHGKRAKEESIVEMHRVESVKDTRYDYRRRGDAATPFAETPTPQRPRQQSLPGSQVSTVACARATLASTSARGGGNVSDSNQDTRCDYLRRANAASARAASAAPTCTPVTASAAPTPVHQSPPALGPQAWDAVATACATPSPAPYVGVAASVNVAKTTNESEVSRREVCGSTRAAVIPAASSVSIVDVPKGTHGRLRSRKEVGGSTEEPSVCNDARGSSECATTSSDVASVGADASAPLPTGDAPAPNGFARKLMSFWRR